MRKKNVLLISIALVVISLGIVLYFKVFYWLDKYTFASPLGDAQ